MEGGGDRAEPISLPTSRKGMGGEDKGTPGRTRKRTKELVGIKGHQQDDSTRQGMWGESGSTNFE